MCQTCGCSEGAKATVISLETGAKTEIARAHGVEPHHHRHGADADHDHHHHGHDHGHHHHHHDDHHHHHDHGEHSHPHTHARDQAIVLEQAVLRKNDELAARNRAWFDGREILALNLVSSPGAGKTTLLERTIRDCARSQPPFFVIEGDQATTNDGERIRAAGAPAVQVNTGTGCHLDAEMIACGLRELAPSFGSVVFIENVGNLVCPALFDLGERAKVAIVSVTEGEDKPIKYPHMFQASELVLINKIDLLPHLSCDIDLLTANVLAVNPNAEVFAVSATTGEGMPSWYGWLAAHGQARQGVATS